jgi:hypothetical protein
MVRTNRVGPAPPTTTATRTAWTAVQLKSETNVTLMRTLPKSGRVTGAQEIRFPVAEPDPIRLIPNAHNDHVRVGVTSSVVCGAGDLGQVGTFLPILAIHLGFKVARAVSNNVFGVLTVENGALDANAYKQTIDRWTHQDRGDPVAIWKCEPTGAPINANLAYYLCLVRNTNYTKRGEVHSCFFLVREDQSKATWSRIYVNAYDFTRINNPTHLRTPPASGSSSDFNNPLYSGPPPISSPPSSARPSSPRHSSQSSSRPTGRGGGASKKPPSVAAYVNTGRTAVVGPGGKRKTVYSKGGKRFVKEMRTGPGGSKRARYVAV